MLNAHLDKKVVLWGQSCVGKTTFARTMPNKYLCFDYLYPWHIVESFPDTSIPDVLDHIKQLCEHEESYVLDGWNLADTEGKYLPDGSTVYVIYDSIDNILQRYRVDVIAKDEHREMWRKWYLVDFSRFPRVRYFHHTKETDYEYFNNFRELERVRLSELDD